MNMVNRWRFLVILAVLPFVGWSANSVFTWQGGTTGNWNDSANWLCDGAATDRWPGKDTASQNNTDEVRFDAVTTTVTLTSTTYVKAFRLLNGADITITSDSTKRSLYVYPPGLSVVDSELTFDTVTVLHSTGANEWGCLNGSPMIFNGNSLLTLKSATFRNGQVSADVCYKVRCYNNSSLWYRYTNTGIKSFDFLLDNSSFSGHKDNTTLQACTNSVVTFAGTTPSLTLYKNKCKVPGTLTVKYVLPSAPYGTAPIRSNQAIDFDNENGNVKIEIDSSSPGLTSGLLQTYRLFKWDTSLENGIVMDHFQLPTLRTQDEVFTRVWKTGAAATVPPQYLDVTIDGAFDPDNAPMEATFSPAASFRPEMRFAGNISSLGVKGGVPASGADVLLQYGADDSLGTEVNLGSVTSSGDFIKSYSGFDATSTYHYRLILTNDLGQAVTGAVGTCSHICGTQLGSGFAASMSDGRGSVAGSVYVIGAGVTTVRLMLGRNELEMSEYGSAVVDAVGPFAIDVVYPDEGKWYYKLVSSNAYESQQWEWPTETKFVEVTDSNTYTWVGGDGYVGDTNKWTCGAANTGIGFPTSHSTVIFPGGMKSTVLVSNSVNYVHVTFMQDDSDYTFVGSGQTFGMSACTSGGKNAKLTLDGVKFIDPAYIWSGKAYFSASENARITLLDGAEMVYRNYHLNGTNSLLYIGSGSKLEIASGGFVGADSAAVISNGNLTVGNPIAMSGRRFTLIGDLASANLTRNSASGAIFDFQLPATPYATVPIIGGMDTGDFAATAVTTINILRSPAARRNGGTYRLIKWGLVTDSAKTPYGINTNNVIITGLRREDSYSWSWQPGEAYQSLGPQYLDIHYARIGEGMMVFIR